MQGMSSSSSDAIVLVFVMMVGGSGGVVDDVKRNTRSPALGVRVLPPFRGQ